MAISKTDICNRALAEIGARAMITDFAGDLSPAGVQCRLWYDVMRQALLQAAPWSFARKTFPLVTIALLSDDPMPANMYPWMVKYEYPSDCLRVNYILPPPLPPPSSGVAPDVSGGPLFYNPWAMPSRNWRFLPAYDEELVSETLTPRKVLLSNLPEAYAVYVIDVEEPTMFDASFANALSAALAYRLVMPLTGNAGMKTTFKQLAEIEITSARVKDGNEANPSTDHTPDWMAVRGSAGQYNAGGMAQWGLGQWYNGYSDMGWGE
jgi:hypothetical protein